MSFTDEGINKLLFNLENVSKIQRGQLINTSNDYLNIEDQSLSLSLIRTINRDSRSKAISKIKNYIQLSYEYAERLLESKYIHICPTDLISDEEYIECEKRIEVIRTIYSTLKSVISGLKNLAITYGKDYATVGSINEIISDTTKKYNFIYSELSTVTKKMSVWNKKII